MCLFCFFCAKLSCCQCLAGNCQCNYALLSSAAICMSICCPSNAMHCVGQNINHLRRVSVCLSVSVCVLELQNWTPRSSTNSPMTCDPSFSTSQSVPFVRVCAHRYWGPNISKTVRDRGSVPMGHQ